jgi:hypothetical protein
MSAVVECTLVEKAIQRARSLVSPHGAHPQTVALGDVGSAVRSTNVTTQMTSGSPGALINAHKAVAIRNAASLGMAGRTDDELQTEAATAAALTRSGARRMDVIAGHTQATLQAGAAAISPAAQRAVLNALRTQLSHATEVVHAIGRQGADLARRVEALDYGFATAPPLLDQPLPEGPIVWCLRPNGTFGMYRCSILYPDLRVSSYWSPTDDTHG